MDGPSAGACGLHPFMSIHKDKWMNWRVGGRRWKLRRWHWMTFAYRFPSSLRHDSHKAISHPLTINWARTFVDTFLSLARTVLFYYLQKVVMRNERSHLAMLQVHKSTCVVWRKLFFLKKKHKIKSFNFHCEPIVDSVKRTCCGSLQQGKKK